MQCRMDAAAVPHARRIDHARFPCIRGRGNGPEDCRLLGIEDYPSLRELMRDARLVAPANGLRATGRIQRLASRITGPSFALLPTAAAMIDPLHSSGIAHGMSGVLRLARILLTCASEDERTERLRHYEQTINREVHMMDHLVSGCYEDSTVLCYSPPTPCAISWPRYAPKKRSPPAMMKPRFGARTIPI